VTTQGRKGGREGGREGLTRQRGRINNQIGVFAICFDQRISKHQPALGVCGHDLTCLAVAGLREGGRGG